MRIGLNLLYVIPGINGGTESYAQGLLEGFEQCTGEHEYVVYLNRSARDWPLPSLANFDRIVCGIDGRNRVARYAYEQFILPGLLKRDHIQVVHSLGYVGPLRTPCPSVVTIPDLNYKAFGQQMSFARRNGLRAFVSSSARSSDRIIAISSFTRSEIAAAIPNVAGKITVIHLAPRPRNEVASEESNGFKLPTGPYFMAFCGLSKHKNTARLIDAYVKAKRAGTISDKLVLVGRDAPVTESSDIVLTGYQPDRIVRRLLQNAKFLIVPSLYEGFGIPVLEAMEVGIPVTCSRAASLPEVAGDAALLFDPTSSEDIARAIVRMANDPGLREELRTKGTVNLTRFSWEKAAMQTLAVYEGLAERQGAPNVELSD